MERDLVVVSETSKKFGSRMCDVNLKYITSNLFFKQSPIASDYWCEVASNTNQNLALVGQSNHNQLRAQDNKVFWCYLVHFHVPQHLPIRFAQTKHGLH